MTADTDKEIQTFIGTHRDFLISNNLDIAHSSISGDWFVYSFNRQYNYYEFFISFTTLAQLTKIITEEIQFTADCTAGTGSCVPASEKDSIAEQVTCYSPRSIRTIHTK